MSARLDRSLASAGVLMQVALFGTVAFGVTATPSYAWPTDPVSVVGATGGTVAAAFNAGLVLTGLLALGFAHRLWRRRGRVVGGLYALVGAGFALAGVFPVGSGQHDLAALIFLGTPLVLFWAGIADWRAGNRRSGAVGLTLGEVCFGVWLPYDLGVSSAQIGYGAAELVVFVALGAWTVWTTRRLSSRPRGAARERSSGRTASRGE